MNWFDAHITHNDSVFIIAEAGINHNGDFDLALELIREAKKAGADCIKFQTFTYAASESKHSTMPGYFDGRVGFKTKKEWYDSISLTKDQFAELKNYCEETGIAFLSTACDIEGLAVLEKIRVESLKIASADANNDYLLKAVGRTELPVILSTGMTSLRDLAHGIEVLMKNGTKQIALTQCTSQYPTPYSDINLRAMTTLEKEFNLPVGLSDHSEGIEVSIAAVALGAKIIEKHFTLSRNLPGVDHTASIEPVELAKMVKSIRHVESAMGTGVKMIQAAELKNAENMKRSLMAARHIKSGTILTDNDITAKRPGTGIPPSEIDHFIGKKINTDVETEDLFDYSWID